MAQQFCPNCNKERDIEIIERFATHQFKNEVFEIKEKVAICQTCGEDVPDEELDSLTLKKLSDLYLEKNDLSFDDFKNIRLEYGLTQREFAKVLNWGKATIARYEMGYYIPDTTHLNVLKMLKTDPALVWDFYNQTRDKLTEAEQKKIESKLRSFRTKEIENGLLQTLNLIYQPHEETLENGYVEFSADKLFNMILYFARNSVLKTKLMKLLWYADFLMFKLNTVSISGTPYWNYQHGPVPKEHDLVLACLQNFEAITIDEIEKENDYVYIIIQSEEEFDHTLFSDEELAILQYVDKYFESFGSVAISEFAHKEDGWRMTSKKEIIHYGFADTLQLSMLH